MKSEAELKAAYEHLDAFFEMCRLVGQEDTAARTKATLVTLAWVLDWPDKDGKANPVDWLLRTLPVMLSGDEAAIEAMLAEEK